MDSPVEVEVEPCPDFAIQLRSGRDLFLVARFRGQQTIAMSQEKRFIEQWKSGCGIFVRLLFLAILVNLIAIPIRVLSIWVEPGTTTSNVIIGIYLIIVVPLALPEMTRVCGLRKSKVDEIDGSGDMNEASKRKLLELRVEGESRRSKINESQVAFVDKRSS